MIKRIASIILILAAFAFNSVAEKSKGNNESVPVQLEVRGTNSDGTKKVLRSPMRITIEAWYEVSSETFFISYEGEATGVVHLYLNGSLLESSAEINSSFLVAKEGIYTIEIITDSWIATGTIEI